MAYETVLTEKREHVVLITLNRPERMNAVNPQLSKDLIAALDEAGKDNEIRVAVLTGAGRAFCSGGDVTTMAGGPDWDPGTIDPLHGSDIVRKIRSLDKPSIAMVNGPAVGGGCALALSCDLRTGSAQARFMNAFARVGLSSGWGGPWLYPRLMGLGRGLELLLTGDFLEAQEAERLGVLNRLVPADELEQETMKLANRIAAGAPIASRLTRRQVYEGLGYDLDTALHRADEGEYFCVATEDHREGVSAFLEKRTPQFKGK